MFHAPGIGHSDLHKLFPDPCDKVHFFALIQASYWRWLGIVLPIERDPAPGPPHEAFRYVIHYLELRELLALEMTSKDLLETIRREAPHWQRLRVDPALSLKLTDVALWSLARRARGRLESLRLANCQRISDKPLKRVLAENRLISKLDLACCKGVSIQAVMEIVNLHTQPGFQRLRRLRIEGVSGIAIDHVDKLRATLSSSSSKPSRYCYREEERRSQGKISSSTNEEEGDKRVLDVEACPRCALPRVVYDCSRIPCQEKQRSQPIEEQCRACLSCIRRCDRCGGCLENDEYEETFSLEVMCLDCWRLCNCQVCGKHDTAIPETATGCGRSSSLPYQSEGASSLKEICRREVEQQQRQVNAMIIQSYVQTLRSSFPDGRVSSPEEMWRLDVARQEQSVNQIIKSCIATPTATTPRVMGHSLPDRRVPSEEMWRLEVEQMNAPAVGNYIATAKTVGSPVPGQRVCPEEIWRLEIEQQRRQQQINSMIRNYTATPASKTMTPILS